MNTKIAQIVLLNLFLTTITYSQVFLKVNESETKAFFENNRLQINLAVENSATALTSKIKLEVLDDKDNVLTSAEIEKNLRSGKQNLPFSLAFSSTEDADELLWKRLRYTIFNDNSAVSNIVSLSEIMPEIFELQISAPEKIFDGMNLRAHVIALHPFTKQPIKNVEITGDLQLDLDVDADKDELILNAKGKTNDEGFVSLDFKIPRDTKLDDYSHELKIKGSKNGITRDAEDDLDYSPDSFVYLNTDKPIYQPAQKLFVRGLYLDPLNRPLSERDLDFEIKDENGEKLYQGSVKTSRFGVMNIEWQLPADTKLGKYEIEVENDGGGVIGAAEFKVSRYDLPNFTINAKPAKPFYLISETTAEINISASYLFGKSVERGRVKIVQEKEHRRNYEKQDYQIEKGEKVEGETDLAGNFVGRIDLSGSAEDLRNDKWRRFADIKFVAYFTDLSTNRTEEKRFDVRLSKEPIHVYFIRQNADPNPRVPFLFYVSTFYADGTPVKCDLKVDGNFHGTTLDTKIAEAKTNRYGASKFEVRFPDKPFPEASNEFDFRISANDRKGNSGTLEENLIIGDNRQIRVRPDKIVYLPNEPIDLKVFSSEAEKMLFVDVLKNSSVIYSKNLKIDDGRTNLLIPFRPDFSGELTIIAYFFDENRRAVINSKTILYPTAKGFNLNLKSVKAVYRPNEEAKLSFNVQNEAGKSLETALGVLVLDKAIEERAKTEQLPDNFGMIRKLIGTGESFGNLTRKDLDNLDLAKPVDVDVQLAAEFLLVNKRFEPNFFESDSFQNDFGGIYRDSLGKKLESVEKTLTENYRKTSEFPTDENALRRILSANEINFDEIRDAWGMPFQVKFSTSYNETILSFRTASADKKIGTYDDFTVNDLRFEWFKNTKNKLEAILDNSGKKPHSAEELKAIWKNGGIDLDTFRDGWNRPLYILRLPYNRTILKMVTETVGNLSGEKQEVLRNSLVEQKVILFKIRSGGVDGDKTNYDDFDLGTFTVVLEEKEFPPESSKAEISQVPYSAGKGGSGAISGVITDANGAVVPGTIVNATNMISNENFAVKSNDDGEFLLVLPSGKYKVAAQANGFRKYVIQNVVVSSMNMVKIKISLDVADVSSVVEVTADVSIMKTETSNASISVTKSESKSIAGFLGNNKNVPNFTPRVREYFPETLLWQPDLVTDKNGKAELKFKLADNLTTWKLYAVGSTATGEIGLVEKEFQTFQTFFAELDPPKILTEGDEISLPVTVRNYTGKKQTVAVTMAENTWSKMVEAETRALARVPNDYTQNIEVLPNKSANAIFNFRAISPIKDGKQKVTAAAKKEADAIEKPVTVRPNGFENIENQSQMFSESAVFKVNFPQKSFPNSRQATLKIYPNLLSHVAESVDGLLKRPYGCGEQTLSSTYPNLLILKVNGKFKNVDDKILRTARTYLQDGYKRMLNYQTKEGGYSYWGSSPDIALTAYALRFLHDAEQFIQVDETVAERLQAWLLSQQSANGSWQNDEKMTAYIVRVLAVSEAKDTNLQNSLKKGLEFLRNSAEKSRDSYVLANIAIALNETGDNAAAKTVAEKLIADAQANQMGVFWTTQNTPFHGWGKTAEIETTALALQAILPFSGETRFASVFARGLAYLIKNKDEYGVWYSTQTTVNVLDTLVLAQAKSALSDKQEATAIFVNGKKVQELLLNEKGLANPAILDISQFLTAWENSVEIKSNSTLTMAQIVSTHFSDWSDAKLDSKYFDLKVNFAKTQAKIGEEIACQVEIERKNNVNGMVLAEIGIPPGVDVDRNSLKKAQGLSSYDILPDKIVVYLWADKGKKVFSFKFKPRYGINALNAPSLVYDYYNPEAKAVVAPVRFEVK